MSTYAPPIPATAIVLIFVGVCLWHQMSSHGSRYHDLLHLQPAIGHRSGFLAWPLAIIRSLFRSKQWSDEGYAKVRLFDKAALHDIFSKLSL